MLEDSSAAVPSILSNDTTEKLQKIAEHIDWAMQDTVDPCQDFYQYACGGFLQKFSLPYNKLEYYMNEDMTEVQIQQVLEDVLSSGWPIITPFFKACLDVRGVNAAGVEPILPYLDEVWRAHDLEDLMRLAGTFRTFEVEAFVSFDVELDAKDPSIDIALLEQGGVPLPDISLYKKKDIILAYQKHVASTLVFVNPGLASSDSEKQAARIVSFEQALAACFVGVKDPENPETWYHRINRDGVKERAPNLPWEEYFRGLGKADIVDIDVTNPGFLNNLNALIVKTDLETLQDYLAWQLITAYAEFLSSSIAAEHFDFFHRFLEGEVEMPDRLSQCIKVTDDNVGQLLGHYFVQQVFPESARAEATGVVDAVGKAFVEHLEGVTWMDNETRQKAARKVETMQKKIGYPDKWPSFDGLNVIGRGANLISNVIGARVLQFSRLVSKIGGKGERKLWDMTPATLNAYYAPESNTMVIPAAMLLQPNYDPDYPAAVNYGGLGALVGHEMVHGFDDEGSHYDEKGRLVQWISKPIMKEYRNRSACIVDIYNKCELFPGHYVDGEQTLAENIADIAGLKIAYWAFLASLGPESAGNVSTLVPKLTEEQLFFVSYAQSWCSASTKQYAKLLLKEDEHSPSRFRVNVPVANFDQFNRAFNCPSPTSRCDIWW